jgi:septal ring factor EnvC (AmiA/AmiB activator)
MNDLVNNEGEDNPMQEEIPKEERQMEIMTKVLGGRRSGHMKGMGCGVIPTPLSSSRTCSFTQSHNREYILTQHATEKKIEETKKKLEETEKKLEDIEKKLEGTQSDLQETNIKLAETRTEKAKLVDITKNLQATIDMILSRFGGLDNISLRFTFSTHMHTHIK